MRFLRVMAIVAGLGSVAGPGVAENHESCTQTPMILDLADRILRARVELPGFGSNRFGGEAAYLVLRYGDVTKAQGLGQIARLEAARPVHGMDDLRLAYLISLEGAGAVLPLGDAASHRAFIDAGWATQRALLLDGGGAHFFALYQEIRADAALSEALDQRWFNGMSVPSLIIDQSDAFKLDVAERAAAADAPILAAAVLASRSDLTEYQAYWDRNQEHPLWQLMSPKGVFNVMVLFYENHGALPDHEPETAEAKAIRDRLYTIVRAGYETPFLAFLGIFYNMTGDEAASLAAAERLLGAIDREGFDPVAYPEAAWVMQYEALLEAGNPAFVRQSLRGFDVSRRSQFYAGSALETMEWMVAMEALGGVLEGRGDAVAVRADALSADFNWDGWVFAAERVVAADTEAALAAVGPEVTLDMMWRAGQYEAAIALAESALEAREELEFYRDVMKRLDRGCARYTVHPGGGLTLGGMTLYRFE